MSKLLEQIETVLAESQIPQEEIKRGEVREKDRDTMPEPNAKAEFGLKPDDIIGWFATKANMAAGYTIYQATAHDKKEFGKDVFRIYNISKDIAGIVKFNLKKGTMKFIDAKAYEEGNVKFLSAMPYDRIRIDNHMKAFKAFNIV